MCRVETPLGSDMRTDVWCFHIVINNGEGFPVFRSVQLGIWYSLWRVLLYVKDVHLRVGERKADGEGMGIC